MDDNLSEIYHDVMIDVINNVREEFVKEGVDEDGLQQLKFLWELKLMHLVYGKSRYVGSMGAASINDLNKGDAGPGYSPAPAHTPAPSSVSAASSLSINDTHDSVNATNIALGRPAPYMASPRMNQRTDLNPGPKLDMNVAYNGGEVDEAAADGHIPVTKDFLPPVAKRRRENAYESGSDPRQHDGSEDTITMPCSLEQAVWWAGEAHNSLHECGTSLVGKEHLSIHEERKTANTGHVAVQFLSQFDGGFEEAYNEVIMEDYNDYAEDGDGLGEEEKLELSSIGVDEEPGENLQAGASGEVEPPLGAGDDDDDREEVDDDVLNPDAGFETENVVCAQFEKVSRLKSKWKCILTGGIIHVKDREYPFSRAMGEFQF